MMIIYRLAWLILLPVVLIYLLIRSLKDRRYRQNIAERFGFYQNPIDATLWIHANSLGEVRSAASMIRLFLDQGERIVITNMTPAGRDSVQALFGDQIAAGQVGFAYVPLEYSWIYLRFFKAFGPRAGLAMEAEIWPVMITSAKSENVPLFLCNAQYSTRSKRKQKGRFMANICCEYAGILAKSKLQADRFAQIGCQNVQVMGETRFDQQISAHLLNQSAVLLKQADFQNHPILTFASVVAGEDQIYAQMIADIYEMAAANGQPKPLVIYVPRAKEQIEVSVELLAQNFTLDKRSAFLDLDLNPNRVLKSKTDILIGDSFGEMYFYLNLADAVVIGGGFLTSGAHNVIEPISLSKPVFVGPHTWSIEYPTLEAIDAGIVVQQKCPKELAKQIYQRLYETGQHDAFQKTCNAFFAQHKGASARIVQQLPAMIKAANKN